MSTLIQTAIDLSLECRWEEAIDQNLLILETTPNDISTLNRLGKCYFEIGDKESAKSTYQKVLTLDKYNSVAIRNLRTLSFNSVTASSTELVREDFIETPGITKATTLIKLADRNLLVTLTCKQALTFKPKSRLVSVTTSSGTYIGSLPDDLSLKIKTLLDHGYQYQTCLKSATDNSASIFIREIKRPNKPTALPSFVKLHNKIFA